MSVLTAGVQIPSSTSAPIRLDFNLHALLVAVVGRDGVAQLGASKEWDAPGFYVLLGGIGGRGPVDVYVGKATSIRARLVQHGARPKLDWWRAVAVVRDTTVGFNSAEVGYLEGKLASELRELPSVNVIEGQVTTDTTLPIEMRTNLDAFVDTALQALKIIGIDLTPATGEQPEEEEVEAPADSGSGGAAPAVIPGTVRDLLAAGLLSPGAQLEASRVNRETGEPRVAHGEVQANGEILVRETGRAYRSPSKAAQQGLDVVSSNGWRDWTVLGTGTTLAALRDRLNLEPST